MSSLDARAPFTIEITYEILRRSSNFRVGCRVVSHDGTVVLTSTDMDATNDEFEREPDRYVDRCIIPGGLLNCGQYYLSVASDFPMIQVHFSLDGGVAFRIEQTGGIGGSIPDGRLRLLRLQLPWSVTRCGEEPSAALRSTDIVGH
jgi:homopolymeric O-antigen transport system ATP-binding protein